MSKNTNLLTDRRRRMKRNNDKYGAHEYVVIISLYTTSRCLLEMKNDGKNVDKPTNSYRRQSGKLTKRIQNIGTADRRLLAG
jgi:hypothetical protein